MGKKVVSCFPVKFSLSLLLLFHCAFWFDFATSVSGPLIPVQNDHLNFQIGFCLFCFFLFILLGLGWGGRLAGRTHSFSFKFSWDKTSSWDSHPYHTWRLKGLPLHFFLSQEPVPDCLQLHLTSADDRFGFLSTIVSPGPLTCNPYFMLLLTRSGQSCLNSSAQPLDRTSWMYFR